MYGFMAKLSIATLNICQILMRRKDVIVDPNVRPLTIAIWKMQNHLSLIVDGKHIELNEYPRANKTSSDGNI